MVGKEGAWDKTRNRRL